MAKENGNGVEPRITRKPFKKGEKDKHLQMLAQTYLALEDSKAKTKKLNEKLELIAEDVRMNGYADDDQQHLPIDDDDDQAGARA